MTSVEKKTQPNFFVQYKKQNVALQYIVESKLQVGLRRIRLVTRTISSF